MKNQTIDHIRSRGSGRNIKHAESVQMPTAGSIFFPQRFKQKQVLWCASDAKCLLLYLLRLDTYNIL